MKERALVIHEGAGPRQGHGLRAVGRRGRWDGCGGSGSGPVIHSAARGGPECLAGLGGSIRWAAVSRRLGGGRRLTTTSSLELPLVTAGRGGDVLGGAGHELTAAVLIVRALARGVRQWISRSR